MSILRSRHYPVLPSALSPCWPLHLLEWGTEPQSLHGCLKATCLRKLALEKGSPADYNENGSPLLKADKTARESPTVFTGESTCPSPIFPYLQEHEHHKEC